MIKKLSLLLALAAVPLLTPTLAAQKFVIVVNPKNPVTRLDYAQVSRIYLGKLQAWKIGNEVLPVTPIDLRPDSPLRIAFSQRVLRKSVSETTSYWRQELYAGRNVPPPEQSEAEALESVRNAIGAIAYVSEKADLKGVKVIPLQ